MPVCSFFLRGVCTKDNCPYVHVSVGKDAEVCQDFLRGYCPSGEQVCVVYCLIRCQDGRGHGFSADFCVVNEEKVICYQLELRK